MVYHQRMIEALPLCWLAAVSLSAVRAEPAPLPPPSAHPVDFIQDVQPILASTCLSCHGPEKQRADYRLDLKSTALTGGADHAPNIIPGNSAESPLIQFVASLDPDQRMPPKKDPLSPAHIGILRRWIDDGASWPEEASAAVPNKTDWWSLRPLVKSTAPAMPEGGRNAVDAFIAATLKTKNLSLSSEADARTLCRRLYFDLTGLPPSPEEVEQFVRRCQSETGPDAAWQELVDTLLASPRYGERWARHWLDVVHFGETHGFDKDQPRPHAWPYRDYVIRSFNADKPYSRFVQEQIAGDILFPGTLDGITALGFIAAGPWDLIGHAEVGEEKIDGKIARHLDRDDMVANTLNTFSAMTVHCAQCHDHKFDPISADDYYSLQSVFAAVDRADRPYDDDDATAARRTSLQARQQDWQSRVHALTELARDRGREALTSLDARIAALDQPPPSRTQGWHSNLDAVQNTTKWVQIDLGTSTDLKQIVLHPCHDNYNQIGDGFGFPPRFKVEISDDANFENGVTVVTDQSTQDFANPGIKPVAFETHGRARHVRLTATTLASRRDAFIFALAEVHVLDGTGKNLAAGAPVTALDSIEAPGAWSRSYLTDQWYPGSSASPDQPAPPDRAALAEERRRLIDQLLGAQDASALANAETSLQEVSDELKKLPPSQLVYAGTVHHGSGAFTGTGANGGKPRPITVLSRGDVRRPGKPAQPGAVSGITALPARFNLSPEAPEGERRAALARWITDPRHPLTWRTIVNRVWHYHFGRGLVDTPNDFGRMGGLPTHPELLDWLATTFRDDMNGSLKELHRLIVTSAAYRQKSDTVSEQAEQIDSSNTLLWRQNRRKLEAEAVRDSVLAVAGKLDLTMGGPSFQDFIVTHPEHSPHYEYHLADPENPALHRRAVYRFLVRSQQQPWMAALDCADPSMLVEKRNQTITPLQALAQLNNQLMITMARHFAARVAAAGPDLDTQVTAAFLIAMQRKPHPHELAPLSEYAAIHGMENTCRLIINLNEFTFVD